MSILNLTNSSSRRSTNNPARQESRLLVEALEDRYLLTANLFMDINTGGANSSPDNLLVVGNNLFFTANDGTTGTELWISDGTVNGTNRVKDINPGAASSSPDNFVAIGNTLFFVAEKGGDIELWKSDGTGNGTQMVKDIRVGATGSFPDELTVIGNTLYFSANDGITGFELWKSDGTQGGTQLVKNIYNDNAAIGPRNSQIEHLTVFNNTLYFAANDGVFGRELWKSDGTENGTQMVADINIGPGSSFGVSEMAVADNLLFFVADNGLFGAELWQSNGTENGTILARDIQAVAPFAGSDIQDMTSTGTELYFQADDGVRGKELWKADSAGVNIVKDIHLNGDSAPENITAVGNKVFFAATHPAFGTEFWTSDGTENGTTQVKDIASGGGSSSPQNLTNIQGLLYFTATNPTIGREVWTSDGTPTGTKNLDDIYVGISDSNAGSFTLLADTIFFRATNQAFGTELWTTGLPKEAIRGRAWLDQNQDGIQDIGEPSYTDGLNVTLTPVNGTPGIPQQITTDVDGNYIFDTINPGDYTVAFAQPAFHAFSPQNQGKDDTLDSDVNSAGVTSVITVGLYQEIKNIDAGLRAFGTLSGRAFLDEDEDGIQDTGEPSYTTGTNVTLTPVNGTAGSPRNLTTNSNGNYNFDQVAPGDYTVTFALPSGHAFSPQDQGNDDTVDSDVNGSGVTAVITVNPKQEIENVDAGFYSAVGTVKGWVFLDLDGDGIQDAGESGYADGTTVEIVNANNPSVSDVTFTDFNGNYIFNNVVIGTYFIRVTNPPSITPYSFSPQDVGNDDTIDSDVNASGDSANFTVTSGQTIDHIDAGLVEESSSGGGGGGGNPPMGFNSGGGTSIISGTAFFDANGNGIREVSELANVPGILVKLHNLDTQQLAGWTLTNDLGQYTFIGVASGTFFLEFVLPPSLSLDYVFTAMNQGDDDERDSDVNALGVTAYFTLLADEIKDDLDVGLV